MEHSPSPTHPQQQQQPMNSNTSNSNNNDTTSSNNSSDDDIVVVATMIQLPKGTMRRRWKVVGYIGLLVTLFVIGSIMTLLISVIWMHRNNNNNNNEDNNNTLVTNTIIDIPMKREMYQYYYQLLIDEITLISGSTTGSSSSSSDSTTTIQQQLLVPSSSEYKALQWLFLHNDEITISTLLRIMNPTDRSSTSTSTTSTSSSIQQLVQRFAITTIYIHFHLYPYMTIHIHECEWSGITCHTNPNTTTGTTTTTNDNNNDNTIITGINITSLLSSSPFSSTSSGSGTSTTGSSTSTSSSPTVEWVGPMLGTTIPTSICYVSVLLQSIDLSYLSLIGTLPTECYMTNYWDHIHTIHLDQNQLHQFFTVPTRTAMKTTTTTNQTTLTKLWPKIQHIRISGNRLKESIVASTSSFDDDIDGSNQIYFLLQQWDQLRTLHVDGNEDLVGQLFESTHCLQYWTNIEHIDISNTRISGTIPDYYYYYHYDYDDSNTTMTRTSNSSSSSTSAPMLLSNLKTFAALRVPLSGSIPNMFGTMATNLEVLALGLTDNVWTGTLPTSYGNLTMLQHLSLSYMNGITGTLPELWGYGMKQLQSIDLFGNPNLGGSIPSSWGGMTSLATLRLAQTNITGTIPSELGQLTQLVDAAFHRTKLHGSVPSELCQLRTDYVLSKLSADCDADTVLSSNTNNDNQQQQQTAPLVTCSSPDCCTACS